jgi:hypothetical protein
MTSQPAGESQLAMKLMGFRNTNQGEFISFRSAQTEGQNPPVRLFC